MIKVKFINKIMKFQNLISKINWKVIEPNHQIMGINYIKFTLMFQNQKRN